MYKNLFLIFSFLFFSQVAFSADEVDYNKPFDEIKSQVSDFDQRHSLMPVDIKPISKVVPESENSTSEKLEILKQEETTSDNVTRIEKDKIEKPEQKFIVKEEVKPVFVVPPAFPDENKNIVEDQKNALDQSLFIPDVNDVDEDDNEFDGKDDEKKNQYTSPVLNNTVNNIPQSINDESKEDKPFVLKEIPQKKFDGTDIIFSNIIDEKAGSMENHPLIINKEKKNELFETPKVLLPNNMINSEIDSKKEDISERKEIIKSISNIKNDGVKNQNIQTHKTQNEPKDILTAHIASYLSEETANKGIDIWKEKYPLITLLKPSIKYENVEGKGMFYRLYLTGDEAKLENLCNQMKSNKDWCNILR